MEQQPIEVRHDAKELAKCKGCLKEVAKNSLLRHVGRHQSCKDYYGDQYQEMLNENKKATQKKVEAKRKEEKIQYQRRYDKENKTPLDLALKKNHSNVVKILESAKNAHE